MIQAVVPGSDLTSVVETHDVQILGAGLRRERDGRVLATNAGALFHYQKRIWVAKTQRKRVLPMEGDYVIGVINEVMGEAYSVDIGAPRLATLDLLAFDGASRRNCPNLQRGSLVFARVLFSAPDCEPVLTCQLPASQQHKKKDWATGEALFGELKQGCMFQISPSTCRRLSDTNSSQVLQALAKYVSFELCVGMNGRVWVNATEDFHVVLVGNAIRASEGKQLSKTEAEQMVKKFVSEMAKFQPAAAANASKQKYDQFDAEADRKRKQEQREEDEDYSSEDGDVHMVDG